MAPLAAAQLIIGMINVNKCAIQPMIPIWLIFTGAVNITYTILKFISSLIAILKNRLQPILLTGFKVLIVLFQLIWFCTGNVWVYSIKNKVQYDQKMVI